MQGASHSFKVLRVQIKVFVVYFILASKLINNGLHISDRFTYEREPLIRIALRGKPTLSFNPNLARFKINIHTPKTSLASNVLIGRKRRKRATRKGRHLISNGLLLTTNRYHARHL